MSDPAAAPRMRGVQMDEPPSLVSEKGAPRPPDEFVGAIGSLTSKDWERLRRIGAVLASGGSMEWEEILQETMARVLDGSRPWPQGLPLLPFLAGIMKSVAHGERAKAR